MPTGEALLRWSIWLALLLYVIAVALLLQRNTGRRAAARWPWTAGCALYLCHVALAFAAYHGWSHAAAYEATRIESRQVVGVDWGGGLYVNYAFTALWIADVVWWWGAGHRRYLHRNGVATALLHGFFALMVFSATVVFETGWLRVAGLAVVATLLPLALHRLKRGVPDREP